MRLPRSAARGSSASASSSRSPGPAVVWDAERLDVTKVTLEAFARAARGKEKFLIPLDEMVHGAAVTEAIIRSSETHLPEKVG